MKYDHIGIPTQENKENAVYIEDMKLAVTPYAEHKYRIEWVKFDNDTPMPKILTEKAHIAFRVDDIEEAMKDVKAEDILVPITQAGENMRVAFIVDDGAPVEFLEY